MHRRLLTAATLVALAVPASADPEADLRAAEQRVVAGDASALDELEALGQKRPFTPWTDDAWAVAARFAEQRGDLARARADLEQLLATTTDDIMRHRARTDLDRLASVGGAAGEWDAVAAEHDRLVTELAKPGDPRGVLRRLEQLVRDHPGYPRAVSAMLLAARGYEREGERDRAIAILRRAATSEPDRKPALAELVRTLVRAGEIDEAQALIATLGDPGLEKQLQERVDAARVRAKLRIAVLVCVLAIIAAGIVALRRRAGSWQRAVRALAKPPTEALFFAPAAIVLVIVAQTGNPLVASAVRWIAFAGIAVAWVSGVLLSLRRPRRIGLVVHALLAAATVLGIVFLAVERDRTLDLVVETWRNGPAMR